MVTTKKELAVLMAATWMVTTSSMAALNDNERLQEIEEHNGPRGIRTLGPRHVKAVS